jgi:hypothetical protein
MALPTTTRCEVVGAGSDEARVWAAGDVTGTTHTHASHYQAGVVAANILGDAREADYSALPRCVFTIPSVFSVGIVPGAAEDAETEAADDSGADSSAGPDMRAGTGNGAAAEASERTRRMLRIARMPGDDQAQPGHQTQPGHQVQPGDQAPPGDQVPPASPASGPGPADGSPRLLTARASLGDTVRAQLGQDDLGCLELYADAESGVLAGAVAVGPDAASWMGEVTLAIRAKIPVTILADVVHAFPTYGEALETALRQLAGTGAGDVGHGTVGPGEVRHGAVMADQEEKGTGPLSEQDIETPEGDAIEQHQELIPDETVISARREVPFDVNEADAADQDRAVGFDDDDYR